VSVVTVPVASPLKVIVTPTMGLPGNLNDEAGVCTVPDIEYLPTNSAVTVVTEFIVIMHCPVPEQPPPLQPAKVESEEGLAVKVTDVL